MDFTTVRWVMSASVVCVMGASSFCEPTFNFQNARPGLYYMALRQPGREWIRYPSACDDLNAGNRRLIESPSSLSDIALLHLRSEIFRLGFLVKTKRRKRLQFPPEPRENLYPIAPDQYLPFTCAVRPPVGASCASITFVRNYLSNVRG